MRIFKSHPLLKLVNSYLIDSPQPSNISYAWNFGSLLLVCLVIQIATGVTLAMHYSPSVAEAFNSIEHWAAAPPFILQCVDLAITLICTAHLYLCENLFLYW